MDKILNLIKKEEIRQKTYVELIASENFVSENVLKAAGSVLTNKYAEGYPGARYYGGCEVVDEIETEAINLAKEIFDAKFANVQPHSGSQANFAAISAMIDPGDKILGMDLSAGGHLTHGYKINFSGKVFKSSFYGVNKDTQMLDYDEILEIAKREKPNLIICGASAYSRFIDFKKFREIADKVGAYLLADIAHIAGPIVAGLHQNPMPYAHVVTSTTHKTLRGPRSGIILTNDETIAKKVDQAVFPYSQGGPLLHIIAAKAIAFDEARQPKYKQYIKDVLDNCKAFAKAFMDNGVKVTAGGTDNHLFTINVKDAFNMTGKDAENLLFKINVICNKNSIPFDTERPMFASGIRFGTAAMTTKGWNKDKFVKLAKIIVDLLKDPKNEKLIAKSQSEVASMLK